MIGAIIGDVVGSIYEFENIKSEDFEFISPGCCYTDDSVLTVATARAILDNAPCQLPRGQAPWLVSSGYMTTRFRALSYLIH
jgi:ADP-ribosylglycohydrolase